MNKLIQFNSDDNCSLSVLGDQPYPAFELRNIVRYLNQSQNQGGAALLAEIGVDKQQLNDDYLPAYKVLEAFKYCSHHLGPVSGTQIGQTYQVNDLGVFGYAIASCKDLKQALHLEDKYYSLLGNILKRGSLIQDHLIITKLYNVQNIDDESLAFFVALGSSARMHIARSIFGDDLKYESVSFTFDDEANREIYEKTYGCKVEFNAEFNGWSLDSTQLKRQLKDGNHADVAKYLPYCNELLENLRQKDSLVNDIQQILVSSAGDYPDIEMLACAFKISSRTLRRQLSNLGTSYQKILNKVRCQLSIEYLTRTGMSIEDVSNLIGFSDVTNFRHAFKKWVGKTPSFYRKTYQNLN